jgi:hypothetical protein
MSTPTELVVTELDAETAQLLPERSAMGLLNLAHINNYLDAKALNFFTVLSDAKASNYSDIDVWQH